MNEHSARIAQLERENEELRKAKSEWDWFFDHSLDILAIHRPDGSLKRISQAVRDILGYAPDEFMAIPMADVVHPEDLAGVLSHINDVATGKDGRNYLARLRHKNGDWRWLAWTTPAGSVPGGDYYAIARDVTAGKLSEAELLHKASHDALSTYLSRPIMRQMMMPQAR